MVTEKNVKELENSQASLTLTVDAASIEKAYQDKLNKYAKTIEMPGFRKGHVPTSVIERKYGKGIREESTFDCMEANLKETIETLEESQRPLPYSVPELQDEESLLPFKKDSDITFTVKYDVYPKFDLPQYTGLEIEVKKGEVTDEDVEKEIKRLQEQNAMVIRKDGAVENGDIVKVDVAELDENGNEIEESKSTDFTFTVGSGYNRFKIDSDIIGMSAGEEKTFDKTYGEDEVNETLKGKTLKLHVKVNEVKYRDLPKVDDDFAQDVKDEYKTVEDLKAGIKADFEKRLEDASKNIKADKIVNAIAKSATIAIPQSMIDYESENYWQRFVKQMGIPEEQFVSYLQLQGSGKETLVEGWKESIIEDLKKQMILDEIRKKEDFKIDEKAFEDKCNEEIKDSYSPEQKEYLKSAIKDEMQYAETVPFLLSNNTFKEGETVSFDAFMNPTEE